MAHMIGTIVIWYLALVLGAWLFSWAIAGAVIFSKQLAYAAAALVVFAGGAWLFSLDADQLLGLALGSSVLVFTAVAPFVGYRLLHGGRNLDQEIAHKLKRDRKAMGYDA